MVKSLPQSKAQMSDVHRFWEQTGSFYARGMGNDNLTDPFIGLGVMPACTALFRDMTGIRFEHPEWDPEACTACGKCYTVCPDTAIPGLVNEVSQVFDTAVKRVRKQGHDVQHLPKAARVMERTLRGSLDQAAENQPVGRMIEEAIDTTLQGERSPGGREGPVEDRARPDARRAGSFPAGPLSPVLHAAEQVGARLRRLVVDHRQPLHLQGLHGVRGGLRRRRPAPGDSRPTRA